MPGERIIALVQIGLQAFYGFIRRAGKLRRDQFPRQVAQRYHAPHALFVGGAQVAPIHPLVAPEAEPAIAHSERKVGNGEICGRAPIFGGRPVDLPPGILSVKVGDGRCQALFQAFVRVWLAGGVALVAVHAFVKDHCTQQHVRVIEKILVDRHAVCGRADFEPG